MRYTHGSFVPHTQGIKYVVVFDLELDVAWFVLLQLLRQLLRVVHTVQTTSKHPSR